MKTRRQHTKALVKQIHVDRMNGMSLDAVAKKHGITQQQVIALVPITQAEFDREHSQKRPKESGA